MGNACAMVTIRRPESRQFYRGADDFRGRQYLIARVHFRRSGVMRWRRVCLIFVKFAAWKVTVIFKMKRQKFHTGKNTTLILEKLILFPWRYDRIDDFSC